MSEHHVSTTDHILASRTLSDAELLSNGAEYQNGVLKVTNEQRESLWRQGNRELGGAAIGSLTLHSPEVSDLEYIGTNQAMERESALRSTIDDLSSRYQDMLKSYFPTEVKPFRKEAIATHTTVMSDNGKEVPYELTFKSRKSKQAGNKVMPETMLLKDGTYDQVFEGEIVGRDYAEFQYGDTGSIEGATVTTVAKSTLTEVSGYRYLDKYPFKGVAPELISLINPNQLTNARNRDMVDTASSVKLDLTPGSYRMEIVMTLESAQPVRASHGLYYEKIIDSKKAAYRFDPETNSFLKTDSSDSEAPESLPASTFIAVVKRAFGNIPSVGDTELVTK